MFENEKAIKKIKESAGNPLMKAEVVENVKVLLGSRDGQDRLNKLLGAEAFTLGSKIAFGAGSPDTEALGHEIAHVVQQSKGRL